MLKLQNKRVWIGLCALLFGFSAWAHSEFVRATEDFATTTLSETITAEYIGELESVLVVDVVDGDTIKVVANTADSKGERRTIRLIGVDTAESVHPDKAKNTEAGRSASRYTTAMLQGREVSLEIDVERLDKYGRELAYVWIDNVMFNLQLLQEGKGVLLTVPPNVKYVDYFTKAQEQAKAEKVGVWA